MCKAVLLTFGLLDAVAQDVPQGAPDTSEQLDYLRIDHHGGVVVATCQCRRTPPLALLRKDFDRRCKLASHYACPVCVAELKGSLTASSADRFNFWLSQHRYVIDPVEHLYASVLPSRMTDQLDGTQMRPRRFIYSRFYGVELSSKDNVMMTCGDANCLNPHHMHVTTSPAQRVTLQMHKDIAEWAKRKLTNRTIQELLEIRHGQSVSIRTISSLKNKPVSQDLIAVC
jgi:hypothetical protein